MSSNNMDKIVILARGLGTRMRRDDGAATLDPSQAAVAASGIKALIPIGRPFLDYVLSAAADAGYRRACLVVGPEQEPIREHYSRAALERISISYALQAQPRGTADAVAAAEQFAAGEPIAVINSDNYYPVEALRGLREQEGCAAALFEREAMLRGNVPEERIKRFAIARLGTDGDMLGVVEKPDEAALAAMPRPLWLSMNCWRFTPAIFDACRAIGPSPRGELELTDAVAYAINELGQRFRAVLIRQPVLDMTGRSDVAAVAALLAGVEVRL
jgi:dTDP-glucose pyrophosphorylase